ncbi:MAG: homocysteine S-methyltransferase family protein, partial [Lentisphaerae bacterium]|nr:homocysteine S-methyltransferase family protein [Lentisphaerota bacterium]
MHHAQEFLKRLQAGSMAGDGDTLHRLQQLLPNGLARGGGMLNLTHPDLVAQVHGEFAEAGAEVVSTNTWDANPIRLGRHGLADQARTINLQSVELARRHAGKQAWIAGVVGPLGLTIDDDWDLETYQDAFRLQVAALLEAGADLIQLKTFGNLAELRLALGVVRKLGGQDIPVIAQMVFNDGGLISSGQTAAQVAESLVAGGANVVGVNCGRGMAVTINA